MNQQQVQKALDNYLKTQNCSLELFKSKFDTQDNYKKAIRDIVLNPERSFIDWVDSRAMFVFRDTAEGYSYWNNILYRIPTDSTFKIRQFLTPYLTTPLTPEQILTIFLKHHRAYTAFKKHRKNYLLARPDSPSIKLLNRAISEAFPWDSTPNYSKWSKLDDLLTELTFRFRITSNVNIDNI